MDCVVVKQEPSAVYDGFQLLDDSNGGAAMAGQQLYVPSVYELGPGALGNYRNDSDASYSSDANGHEEPDDLFQYDEESDSDNDTDANAGVSHATNKHLRWTKNMDKVVLVPFRARAAIEAPGILGTPLEHFHRFFPEELYQVARTETNNYAEFYREKRRDQGRAWWEWTDTHWQPVHSAKEMAAFFGVCLAMAVHSLPEPRDYWSRRRGVGVGLVRRSGLSPGRFDRIMRYLYLSNPWRDPERIANPERRVEACGRDPLYKVGRQLKEHVRTASQSKWLPRRDLVMQELTEGVRRTNGWRLVALRDADSGYVSNFVWHRDPKEPWEDSDGQEEAVNTLLGTLSGMGHRVYGDGVFVSPTSVHQFLDVDVYVTTNRSCWPGEIARNGSSLEVGQSMTLQSSGMTAAAWRSHSGLKRCLSTAHDGLERPAPVWVRDANNGERSVRDALCPSLVLELTAVLDRLPRRSLLLSQSPIIRRLTNTWWKRLVWLLVDVCVVNAYAAWSAGPNPKRSYTEFAMDLASSLISGQSFGTSLLDDVHRVSSESYTTSQVSRRPVFPSIQLCSPPPDVASRSSPPFRAAVTGLTDSKIQDGDEGAAAAAGGEGAATVADGDLMESAAAAAAEAKPPKTNPVVGLQHCLVKFPGRGRNCRQCLEERKRTRGGRRKDTQFGCVGCGLHLCRLGCFAKYHRLRSLKIRTVPLGKIKRINRRPPPLKRKKYTMEV